MLGMGTVNEAIRDTMLGLMLNTVTPKRSPKWPKVRAAHLKRNPTCAACGQRDTLSVHHMKPFHLFPELELVAANLLTLCEDGPGNSNCHLFFGHCGSWVTYNPAIVDDAAYVLAMLGRKV